MVFSTVSCPFPFQAETRSKLPLLHPTLSISTCHSCSSSALTAFSTCTLTAMPLASANLFNLQGLAHASFYTNQLLHQPAFMRKHCFTLSTVCRNSLLHQPAFTQTCFYTNSLFHKPPFTPTSSCTNGVLHAPASTVRKPTFRPFSFYTNRLLDKPPFTQTTFYILLHQPALHNPCFRPVGQRPEGRRNAQGC